MHWRAMTDKETKASQNGQPTSKNAVIVGAMRCAGHSTRARCTVRLRQASAQSPGTSRAHHTTGPNTTHPAWINQNKSGGLWW